MEKITTKITNVYNQDSAKFINFEKARSAWKESKGDIFSYREKIALGCHAIKNLYIDGKNAGLTPAQVVELINENFPMSKDERSKAVLYADNAYDIQAYLVAIESKAVSIDRMTRIFSDYLKGVRKARKVKEIEKRTDVNKHENAVEQIIYSLTPEKPKEAVKVLEMPKETGINVVSKEVTADEFYVQVGQVLAGVRRRYDKAEFSSEQTAKIIENFRAMADYIESMESGKKGEVKAVKLTAVK